MDAYLTGVLLLTSFEICFIAHQFHIFLNFHMQLLILFQPRSAGWIIKGGTTTLTCKEHFISSIWTKLDNLKLKANLNQCNHNQTEKPVIWEQGSSISISVQFRCIRLITPNYWRLRLVAGELCLHIHGVPVISSLGRVLCPAFQPSSSPLISGRNKSTPEPHIPASVSE